MEKLRYLFLILIMIFSCSSAEEKNTLNSNLKRYLIESGEVHYTIKIEGNVLIGTGTIEGVGTRDVYFKNWGSLELNKENIKQTTTVSFNGQTTTEADETRAMNKLDGLYKYSVNFDENKIIKQKDFVLEAIKNSSNYDPIKLGEQLMLQSGGTKLPNEVYKGYDCEVWSVFGVKLWGYKGITLKTETSVAGVKTVIEATDIRLDVAIDDNKLKLPDMPIEEL